MIRDGDLQLRIPLHQREQHLRQLFIRDVLGAFAAAPDVPVALPIVGGGKDQCAAAVGTADQAGHPALVLRDGTAVVFPLGLDRCHAALGGVPGLLGDQRLVMGVGQDDILIGEVPAGAARGVPAHFPDVDRIAQNIFDGAVFKPVPPVGLDAHVIEPLGDGEEAVSGNEAVKDGLDQRGLLGDWNQHIVLHSVSEGGIALKAAPSGLLRHAPLDLLRQIQGVVFVHGLDHGFHDDAHFVVGQGLADGDDLNAKLPAEHGLVDDAVLPVPGEPGELPEENGIKRPGLLLGGTDHPVELRALFGVLAADALI